MKSLLYFNNSMMNKRILKHEPRRNITNSRIFLSKLFVNNNIYNNAISLLKNYQIYLFNYNLFRILFKLSKYTFEQDCTTGDTTLSKKLTDR